MMRGERDMAGQQMLNHPPEDYAKTFDSEHRHSCPDSGPPEHPVLLTEKGSKWKMYTESQDSDSEEEVDGAGLYTTNKPEFDKTHKKIKIDLKRLGSGSSKPHPPSKVSRTRSGPNHAPSSTSVSHSQASIHPYSIASDEMDQLLSGSKSSCYFHSSSDRYRKLDDGTDINTPSLHPFSSSASESGSSKKHDEKSEPFRNSPKEKLQRLQMTPEDKMAVIREDISRFSKSSATASGSSVAASIPAVSSRWSKFMSKSEEGDEEEGESVETHMLQSRVAVARYN
ncbi:hypothetical protein GBAR_LOCUS16551 [Geodia barretti]|uniref:Uncharacterized protein n=1 Tax=Geodia barretti TaxID=519541 RepID=A0AA35WWF4_GEOBA|nr:hypothetical protein GBAR_LOCUS16551 [Geodia barretti]